MTEVVPIEQLTIDDVTFVVADLPEEIQALVRKYEDWRDRYTVAEDELMLVSSALRDLGANIVGGVKAFEEAKAAAAVEAEAAAEEAPAPEAAETLVVDGE